MMNKFLIFFVFIQSIAVYSQNQLYIKSGMKVSAQSPLTLHNADLNNYGLFQGHLTMTGDEGANTYINNNGAANFTVLNISGNNAVSLENENISVTNAINLNSDESALMLSGANILLESTAEINHESNTRPITGGNGAYITISKTHSAATPELFGNIGFEVEQADMDMGLTEVFRRYGPVPVQGNESLNRYYEIHPANNTGTINAVARFYFTDTDLNGLQKASLGLYQSADGLSGWTEEASSLNDELYPYLKSSGVNPANYWVMADSGIAVNNTSIWLSQVSVYPNPASDLAYLRLPDQISLKKLALTDINGRKIQLKFQDERSLNVSHISNGIYFLWLYTDKGIATEKLIIRK